MEEYTERFINRIIDNYKSQLPKDYRKFEYNDKSQKEQFMEAITDHRIEYEDITRELDELFNNAVDDGKYSW